MVALATNPDEHGMMYVYLDIRAFREYAKTTVRVDAYVDYDVNGKPIGVEICIPPRHMPEAST